jgi:hypothetical protein
MSTRCGLRSFIWVGARHAMAASARHRQTQAVWSERAADAGQFDGPIPPKVRGRRMRRKELLTRKTLPAAPRPARHKSFIFFPFPFSPLRAEIPGLDPSPAAFLRRPRTECAIANRRMQAPRGADRSTDDPETDLHGRSHRIGANPAPNAINIRVYSHFGPIATSGKSPTGS